MKKITIICMGILQLLALDLLAQGGFASYPNTFGLSNLRTSLKIDPAGNKWMGTNGTSASARGAYKFDGAAWSVYNVTNSGIASNVVNDIAFDVVGNTWFATNAGVSKFDGSSWITYNISNSGLPNDSANCIVCDGSNIWIGTNQGVAKFDGSAWINYNTSNSGLINNFVSALSIVTGGDLWIGTKAGLSVKQVSGWISYDGSNSNFVSDKVTCIYEENASTKWFGTSSFGVFKFTGNTFISYQSIALGTNAPRVAFVNTICKGPQGGVLFIDSSPYYYGTISRGFIEVTGSSIYVYPFPAGYNSNFQRFDPATGKIWFITRGGSGVNNCISSFDYTLFSGSILAQEYSNLKMLDINQVRTEILNRGDMHWDLNSAGYEVPKNSGRNAIFTSSLWIGGLDAGNNLHQAAMTYRQTGNDYWPGPLDTITATTDSVTSYNYDKIWKLDRWEIDEFRTMFANGSVAAGTYIPAANIINWPANGAGTYTRNMAPFVDVNGDGIYNPMTDGDYPKIKGDQMCYWIFNDNLKPHTETGGQALRVEIHASAYAYNCDTIADSLKALNYTTFYDYEIYNRGSFAFHNTYVGLWQDDDLGGYGDDYVGCNPAGNYAFVYNHDSVDEGFNGVLGYGANPPMVSNVILNGPLALSSDGLDNDNDGIIDETGEKNLMTNVLNHNNSSDPVNGNPNNAQEFYNYMQGLWQDGSPIAYGSLYGTGTGSSTHFMYDGVPGAPGWSEATLNNPSIDRRINMSCGPFDLNPAQHVNFNFAVVYTRDDNPTYSIASLYNRNWNDIKKIQQWYAADNFPSCASVSTGVVDKASPIENVLNLYPNPASSVLNIDYTSLEKNVIIEIYDIQGQLIKQVKPELGGKQSVNISELSKGLYLVKVSDGKNTSVQRFVKQ